MRSLFAGPHDEEHHDEHHHDEHHHDEHYEHGAHDDSSSRDLRIAAIFIICVGALLGGLIPLLSARFRKLPPYVSGALRAFGGGVILALALLHIIPHGMVDMASLAHFPYAGLLLLAGVFIMIVTEHGLHAHFRNQPEPTDSDAKSDPAVKDSRSPSVIGHSHYSANNSGASITKVTAWMMELGCVFHSVIIGLDLGITTKLSTVTTLLVALVFHQLVEGISLGTVIVAANFSKLKSYAMIFIYSITTPVGIAIGIAVAESYDDHSRQAIITKGIFDGLSGGILIYIALVHLIWPEFSSIQTKPWQQRMIAYLAFAVGAAIMSVLGIWA